MRDERAGELADGSACVGDGYVEGLRREGSRGGAESRARLDGSPEVAAMRFEAVDLALQLGEGILEAGSLEEGFVAFPRGVEELPGQFRRHETPLVFTDSGGGRGG